MLCEVTHCTGHVFHVELFFTKQKKMWSGIKTILPPFFFLTEGKGGLVLGFGSGALLHTFAIH